MASIRYLLRTGRIFLLVEIEGRETKSHDELDRIVFSVAGEQILKRGGGIAIKKVLVLMSTARKRPADVITDAGFPGTYVWFPGDREIKRMRGKVR
jgi:hypothetical protein